MKNFILKLLGFDEISIQKLRGEVDNLKTTISSLKDEITDVYEKTEQAFFIINMLDINKNDECWWEKSEFSHQDHDDINVVLFANSIRDRARENWIRKHPSVRVRKTHHGGCLNCKTPLENGVGVCLGCQYMNANWQLPDLSKED